ncbi:MAG: LCP family protein [Clostridia bacterium]|nr:LCP family protein [Clostridia bacterium]
MKSKFNIKRYFQVLGTGLLVVFLFFVGMLFITENEIDSELDPTEIATVSTEELDGKINVLFLGLDESELRTDCIMIASYDMEFKQVRILSIPRDTRMHIGSRYQKINAAHAIRASHGEAIGAQGTVEAVTRLTGIPINYYVELPFNAVEECIDIIGPVTFDVPDLGGDGVGMVYDDPVQDLHINIKPGVQELDGEQVVHLLRYRKGNYIKGKTRTYKNGDVERISVQQDFVKALIDQKLNAKLIADIPLLFNQVSKSLKTNLSFKDVVRYAPSLTGFDAGMEESIKMWTLPGASGDINGVSYYICDLEETKRLVEEEFGFDASGITDGRKSGSESKSTTSTNSTSKSTQKATAKPDSNSTDNKATTKPAAKKTEAPEKTEKATEVPTKKPVATKAPEKDDASSENKTPVKTKSPDSEPSSTKTPTKGED